MKEKQLNLDSRRWLVLIASCLINLCIGSIYAWSVFSSPLAEKLNALANTTEYTTASLAIVFTIANSVGPITMISGGSINDKLGPKWVVFVGGLLFGGGMLASGFVASIPMLIVTYGLGCGLGMGLVYGCTINNSVKFFPDKRGLIGGIATATYGLSSVLIPPVANALMSVVSVSQTFVILGAAFILIVCVFSMFIIKCPENYCPKGYAPPQPVQNATAVSNDKDWRQMLVDPMFYLMIIMLMCGAFSGLMITSQASPMAQYIVGMSVGMAATTVSLLALFNATGRVVAGYLSDRFGRIAVLLAAFVLEIVGLMCLLTAGNGGNAQFMVGVSIIGICFGSLMGVYPGFTADQFGTKNNSVNYGIMFIGFALAGFFGPTVVGSILSSTGAYTNAFFVAGALSALGIILSLIYQRVQKKV